METTTITRSAAAEETLPVNIGDVIGLKSNMRLMKESMRRSQPNMLVSGRHGGGGAGHYSGAPSRSTLSTGGSSKGVIRSSSVSRTLTAQTSVGDGGIGPWASRLGSASSGSSVLDAETIRLHWRKRSSKSSLVSNGSGGSDNRPFSAESASGLLSAEAEKVVRALGRSPLASPTPPDDERVGGSRKVSAASNISNMRKVSMTPTQSAATAVAGGTTTHYVRPSRGSEDNIGHGRVNFVLVKHNTESSLYELKRPKSHYVGESVFQIDDYVYIGGIECAYNNNLLCRLNIEYIVDVCGLQKDQIPRSKRSDCPCLCSRATAHSRARMQIDLFRDTTEDLVPYFKQVNAFIERARNVSKCVLISSYDGTNRCATFAVQYLMRFGRLDRETALERVQAANPRTNITDNFHRSLRRWALALADKSPIGNSNAMLSTATISGKTASSPTSPSGSGGGMVGVGAAAEKGLASPSSGRREQVKKLLSVPGSTPAKRNAWT